MKHTSKSKSLSGAAGTIYLVNQEARSAAFLGAYVKYFFEKRWRKNKKGISEAG